MSSRRIAHISDLHFGKEDPVVADGLISALSQAQPDLVVVSGDLTQRATELQFRAARAWLDQIPFPVLAVPGNHDVPLFNVWRRFVKPLDRYFEWIHRDENPKFQDARMAVLGLNTARSLTWKNGRISMEQMEEAREFFSRAGSGVYRVLVTHHVFLPPPDRPRQKRVGRGTMALNWLDEHNPDVVLAGHLHRGYHADMQTWDRTLPRSVLAIQAGTAISVRRRGMPNTWNLLDLSHQHLTLTMMAWNGAAFEAASHDAWEKRELIWTPLVDVKETAEAK